MWERRWRVSIDGDVVTVVDHVGGVASIAPADVATIAIETDDSGPWGADLWWWLCRDDGSPALMWPQGASGEGVVIERIAALRDVDWEAMIRAQASSEVARFVLWQRPGDAR